MLPRRDAALARIATSLRFGFSLKSEQGFSFVLLPEDFLLQTAILCSNFLLLFSPLAGQEILDVSDERFVGRRFDGNNELVVVCNIREEPVELNLKMVLDSNGSMRDLLSEDGYNSGSSIALSPYQCCWLVLWTDKN